MSATSFCSFAGNFTRSFGHHAPEAPNPSIVCAAAAATWATVRFAGVAIVDVAKVGDVAGTGCEACVDEEHDDATRTPTAAIRAAQRIAGIVPRTEHTRFGTAAFRNCGVSRRSPRTPR